MSAKNVESLTYLHQNQSFLLKNNSTAASVINFPFRLGMSFTEAAKLQYQQALASNSVYPGYQTFMSVIGYFFSNYAIACFVTALLLNRFVMMSTTRSTVRRSPLSQWSTTTLHLSALIPLVLTLLHGLAQVSNFRLVEPLGVQLFLTRTFIVFAWSHCVETFITVTTNSKPLEESDFTIFELSVQFYFMTNILEDSKVHPEDFADSFMAIGGRILIHLVELFNKRNYRLLGSTIFNVIHLGFFTKVLIEKGFKTTPFATFFRHFPKIFSILLIAMSTACYGLACLVRKDPFGNASRNTEELQYYSFMNNWWNHLNCTGEQEFSVVVSKLALLLCKGTESINNGVQKEFPSLKIPLSIHHSYLISGHNNELPTLPKIQNDYLLLQSTTYENDLERKNVWNVRKMTLQNIYHALKGFNKIFRKVQNQEENVDVVAKDTTQKPNFDLNTLITEKNYVKFLTRQAAQKNEIDDEFSLLPETDNSRDYKPDDSEILYNDEYWESNYESEEDQIQPDSTPTATISATTRAFNEAIMNDENNGNSNNKVIPKNESSTYDKNVPVQTQDSALNNEVLQLLIPTSTTIGNKEELSWLMSTWNILNCQLQTNTRLTRLQYSKLNPQLILSELTTPKSSTKENLSNDEDDATTETTCVVCKTNERNIVLWPCRCLALCEDCRISLGLRGFQSCICCRSEVHGYSKLHRV